MSDVSPESLSVILNGVLALTATSLGYFFVKAKPELTRLTQYVTEITQDVQVFKSVLNQIKSLVTACRTAAQDQNITPEEADKIIKEIEELVNSEPVKKLLGEG